MKKMEDGVMQSKLPFNFDLFSQVTQHDSSVKKKPSQFHGNKTVNHVQKQKTSFVS